MTTETRWIRSTAWDLSLAALWLPFAALALLALHDSAAIVRVVTATLVLSFAHQPLTLALVYGDHRVVAARRALFAASPLVMVGLVLAATHLAPLMLAVIAGAWNAAHTMQQRYGISRIYARLVGQSASTVERSMLWSWLVVTLLAIAAHPATSDHLERSGLGGRNRAVVELLAGFADVASVLVLVALAVAAALAFRWWREEAAQHRRNRVKWMYLASTGCLLAVAIVNPIVGLVAYVGSHAVEYLFVVHHQLARRYPDASTDGGALLGRTVRGVGGRGGFLAGYAALVSVLIVALDRLDPPVATTVALTLGGLHIWYDGFIWKLRQPAVARGFDLPATTTAV